MKLFLTGIQVPDQVVLSSYGDGTYTGTAAYSLTVDNAGNVIESSLPSPVQIGYFVDQTPDNGTYGLLSGAINGANSVFTVSQVSYISGTLVVYLNGQLQTQGVSNDFQETVPSSGTFTFITPPVTNDVITVYYQTSSSYASGIEVLDESVSLTSYLSSLNFVGAGVTATNTGDAVTVTIPGGGGSVDGTGTATYIPKWLDSDTLTDSIIREEIISTNPYIGVDIAAEQGIMFKVRGAIASKGDYGADNYVYLDPIGKVTVHQLRPAIQLSSYSDPSYIDSWVIDVRSTEEGLVIKPDNTNGSADASFRVRAINDSDRFVVNLPDNLVASYSTFVLDGGTTPLELRFLEDSTNGVHYTGFKAPTSLAANLMYTMPSVAPTNGQVLAWNTGGGLSWETSSGGVSDGDKGDITVSSGGTVWTIDTAAVTLAKMADVATASVFYRKTGGTGVPEVQTLATLKTDLDLTGTNTGDQTITLTGDVTGTGTGSFTTTIAAGAVDIAMLSATGTPSGSTFLRGDNTWATPAGSGDVSKVGTPVDNQVGVWTGDGTIEGTAGFTYNGLNLQVTGDIGSTGTRITKGWFTDLEVTNEIAGSVTGNAATVTTNANLTGHITSTGNAAVLGSFTVAQLNTAISDAVLSGDNTGDQTITLTGDVTGTGTGSFTTTIAVGAGGIYEGSGTIASATVSTLTSTSTFEIDYAGGNDAIKIDDTAGTTTLSSKTTGALTIASDIVSLQGKSTTSEVSELRFYEASVNGSNYVGLKTSVIMSGNPVFTLPVQLPSTTQVMISTNTGTLSFTPFRNFRNFFALNTDGFVNVTADQNEDGITFYSDDNSIRMVGDNDYGGNTNDAITFRLAIDKLTNSLTDLTLAPADTFVVWDATASENKSLTVQSLTDYIGASSGDGNGIYTGSDTIAASAIATITSASSFTINWPSAGGLALKFDNTASPTIEMHTAASGQKLDLTTSLARMSAAGTTYYMSVTDAGAATIQSNTLTLQGATTTTVNLGGGTGAGELRFLEPSGNGTNYTSFQAGAMATNVSYILPLTAPGNGQGLVHTTGMQLTWADVGDVFGPISAVSGNISSYNGTSGKSILDSGVGIASGTNTFDLVRGDAKLTISDLSGSGDYLILRLSVLGRPQIGSTTDTPVDITTATNEQTLSNKRYDHRKDTYTSTASINIDGTSDLYTVSALAVALSVDNIVSLSPLNGAKATLRIKDNGTTRALSWDANFISFLGAALPTATIAGKWMYFGMIYYDTTEDWHVVAYSTQI